MWRAPLTLACCLLLTQVQQSDSIHQTIDALNRGIGAHSNIVYDLDNPSAAARIIPKLSVPRVIITAAVQYELRDYFNANILSLVLLGERSTWPQLEIVARTLKRWHRTDLLFIANAPLTAASEWLGLFRWCWDHGFYNVLLTDSNATQLLALEPFPTLRPISSTVATYLQRRNHWPDFQGYPLRVLIGYDPPRSLLYHNKDGQLQIRGSVPQYVNMFALRYNATFVPLLAPNLHNYSLYVCLQHLRARKADICGDLAVYDGTNPISNPVSMCMGYIMVRYAQPIDRFLYFLAPFQPHVWLAIVASVGCLTLLAAALCRRQCGFWHVGKFLLATISSVVFLSFDLAPLRGNTRHVVFFTLVMVGFMLSNFYMTYLYSILGTNLYEPQINTVEQLRDRNVTVLTHAYQTYIFKIYGLSDIILNQMREVPLNELKMHRDSLDPKYGYMNVDDRIEMYMYQQKFMVRPRLKALDKPVLVVWGGLPLSDNWPFEEMFHAHMLSLFATGLKKRIMDETKEEAIRIGYISFFKTEYYTWKPLDAEYFEMPAMLLALGYCLAAACLIVEYLRYWWHSRKR